MKKTVHVELTYVYMIDVDVIDDGDDDDIDQTDIFIQAYKQHADMTHDETADNNLSDIQQIYDSNGEKL